MNYFRCTLYVFYCLFTNSLYGFDINKFEFIDCFDGDTCNFNILEDNFPSYLNPMSIRILGVDTAEIRGKKADKAKANKAKLFTINFIKNSTALTLKNCKKDKYFRFDCEFIDGNKSLSRELIKNKLALPYLINDK